jgi:hypothetical protein
VPGWTRHEIVARAFGRARRQDRRLELGEALLDHASADRRDDLRAQHDIGVNRLAPEIEETIFEPHLLGIIGVGIDRQRQRLRLGEHLERRDLQLHLAGRQLGIDGLGRAFHNRAADADYAFEPLRIGALEERARAIDDALGDAVMVAEVDKEELSVVALPMHPAGEPHRLARVRKAQLAAGVGSISVHRFSIRGVEGGCRKNTWMRRFVKRPHDRKPARAPLCRRRPFGV